MKAIRVAQFGDPGVLKLEDVSVPVPTATQIVVRVHAAGVNPVETYIRSGSYARKPSLPYTPGTDGAGVVEAIGSEITQHKVGDRVYLAGSVSGTYAEFALCEEAHVHPLPENLSFSQGAAIGVPYATAYRALIDRAACLPEELVLVHGGSGGVGLAAIQIARAHGLRVFATASTPEGRDLVRAQGAHEVFDHRAPDYLEQVRAAAGSHGVDIVLEMLANVNLSKDLGLLATHGRVIVIGSRGRVEIDPRDVMGRESDIRGMVLFNTPPEELAIIHAALGAGFESGPLKPVVGKEFRLSDAADAHRAILEPGAHGKIVLLP
jgi:NADPH:quinone reductase